MNIKEEVKAYWTKRTKAFGQLRHKELESYMGEKWLLEIKKHLPHRTLQILDVGTGTGLFSFLLSLEGHHVTAIDATESMIEEAQREATQLEVSIDFQVMDGEDLLFPDASFDIVISRNVMWTLENPEEAYKEWIRVLRPEGILLNFDGNYGRIEESEHIELPSMHAHATLEENSRKIYKRILKELPMSKCDRPDWDVSWLQYLGVHTVVTDLSVGARIYSEIDEFYNPVPMFLVKVIKGDIMNTVQTFENFNVTEGNKLAYSTMLGVADFTKPFNGTAVAIFGDRGSGKTHLLNALGKDITERTGAMRIMKISGEEFLTEYDKSVVEGYVADYVEEFVKLAVLIVDDVSAVIHSNDEGAKKMLHRIISGLLRNGRRVVVSLDESYDSEAVEEDLEQLVTSGVVVGIE